MEIQIYSHKIGSFVPSESINVTIDPVAQIARTNQHGIPGEILFPLIFPRWHLGFQSLEVHSSDDIQIACANEDKQYRFFDESLASWVDVTQPIFQDVVTIRNALSQWGGGLQLRAKLGNESILKEVLVAVRLEGDPLEYLLQFALPELLRQPYQFSFPTIVKQGGEIATGSDLSLFNFSRLESLKVRVSKTGNTHDASVINGKIVVTNVSLPPGTMVMVHFGYSPDVEYQTADFVQVTSLPSIVIVDLGNNNLSEISPLRTEGILAPDGTILTESLLRSEDRELEIITLGNGTKSASILATGVQRILTRSGSVYLPPFDQTIAIQPLSLNKKPQYSDTIKGAKSDYSIRAKLHRIPYTYSDSLSKSFIP